MPTVKSARCKVKPESVEKCREICQQYVALLTEHEPGTLFYTVVQEREDPTVFLFFRMSVDGTEDQHNNAPYLPHHVDLINAECIEPLTGTEYLIVASNFPDDKQ